jgi:hypothetical protein
MNLLALARAAKLCALVGFALPWLEVSCSGVHETASGLSLLTSHAPGGHAAWYVGLALAAIVGGLALSLVVRQAPAKARVLLIASLAAAALVVAAVASRGGEDQRLNRQMRADVVQIQTRYGLWVTLAALLAAAGLSGAALAGRGASAES